ncbi:MAG TPA: DUF4139 domain-containing protein [Cytophagaceae bacterium]|jgi:uncharacterized protein (TIGR02231 family)|nr:DUF4139 domain-containing protein [Cytophagaceae bacterium]
MIKEKILSILCIAFSLTAFSQEKEIKVQSTISEVLVYLNGASVHRQATANIGSGRTKLKFSGLPRAIAVNSIQASLSGNAKIISISQENDFLNNRKENRRIAMLKDSVESIQTKLEKLQSDKNVYEQEKLLLTDNISRIGEGGGIKTVELTAATVFYRTKMTELNDKLLKMTRDERALTKLLTQYNDQLSELNSKEKIPSSNILLVVDAPSPTQTQIDLSYLAGIAAWTPKYDLRTSGAGSPIHFEYRAEIFNDTGEDWEKVKLTLSTADPSEKMKKPILEAWGLDFSYNRKGNVRKNTSSGSEGMLNSMQMNIDVDKNKVNREAAVEYAEIEVSEVSAEFTIKEITSVPSDGLPYIVDINEYDLPATYNYYCVPKIDKDVYLIGKIVGWESLNLIAGDANIYINGTYVGKSLIDSEFSSDTLELFLGRDRKVVVNRVKKQDYGEEKFIGTNRKENFIYVIDVRNANSAPIDIEIVDQVPIAQESEIEVNVKETTNAKKDDLSGKLSWHLSVKPLETKKLTIAFSVKYPRNKIVLIQKNRKVMCPKFR